MFSSLRSWFRSRSSSNGDQSIYSPKERRIYAYWDGQKQVKEDPAVLYRKFLDVAAELDVDFKIATSISKDARQGQERALAAVRKMFSIKPLNDGGLTEDESFELFSHFLNYNESLKKNLKPSRTSSVSMADSIPTSEGSSAIVNSMASGSTNVELPIAIPE